MSGRLAQNNIYIHMSFIHVAFEMNLEELDPEICYLVHGGHSGSINL